MNEIQSQTRKWWKREKHIQVIADANDRAKEEPFAILLLTRSGYVRNECTSFI